MSDTLQVDASDDEITMVDPFDSEEVKDVSSDGDITMVPRNEVAPENLVEVTLSESDDEQGCTRQGEREDEVTFLNDGQGGESEEDEITLVDFDGSSEERKEGEIFLAPRSKDKDHGTIRRKRQRAKKVNVLSCYYYSDVDGFFIRWNLN